MPPVTEFFPCRQQPHVNGQVGFNHDLAGVFSGDLQIDTHGRDVNVGGFILLAARVETRKQEAAYKFRRGLHPVNKFTGLAFPGASLYGQLQNALDDRFLCLG